MYTYRTHGTCSRAIDVELDGDKIESVQFYGGCDGNLKAISKIVRGMTVDQVAEVFEGNSCNGRPTSCADQLVRALRAAQASA